MALDPPTIEAPTPYGFGFVAADPSGQYVFVGPLVYNSKLLSQFVIGADGTLTANSAATSNYGDANHQFTFAPNGKFAVFPNIGGSTTSTYSLSSSGTLTLDDSVTSCNQGPVLSAVDPTSQFVYIGCLINGPAIIDEYSLSPDGTLNQLSPSSIAAEGVNYLQIAPNNYLYTVNSSAGTVTAFWIDETTGQLANAGRFATGTGNGSTPAWITFTPNGSFAYVVNSHDNSVTQFKVDATSGALTMNGPDAPAGNLPIQVVVDPGGQFAFVLNEGDGTISQFTIDSSGKLQPNGTFSTGQPSAYAFAMAQH